MMRLALIATFLLIGCSAPAGRPTPAVAPVPATGTNLLTEEWHRDTEQRVAENRARDLERSSSARSVATVRPVTPPTITRAEMTAVEAMLDKLSLEIVSHVPSARGNYLMIDGQVRNNSTKPLRFVKVEASFFDSADNFVGSDFTYVRTSGNVLQPGATGTFQISRNNTDRQTAKYEVDVLL